MKFKKMKGFIKFALVIFIMGANGKFDVGYAQEINKGIHFEEGKSWKEIKELATKENKYIFMYCFVTPVHAGKFLSETYKQIKDTIFFIPEVRDFFNKNFINIKVAVDTAEQSTEYARKWYEDIKEVQKKYNFYPFAASLFFDPQGKAVHRIYINENVKELIKEASNALDTNKQLLTIRDQLDAGRKDSAFLLNAINLGIGSAANIYIQNIKNPLLKENIEIIVNHTRSGNDPGFAILANNQKKAGELWDKKKVDSILTMVILNEILREVKQSRYELNWQEMSNSLRKKYPKQSDIIEESIAVSKIEYCYQNKDWNRMGERILSYTKDYQKKGFNDYLMNYANNWAWFSFINLSDSKILEAASMLSRASIKSVYFHGYIDTYANLLYKLYKLYNIGSLENAIEWEEKALKEAVKKSTKSRQEEYSNIISSMKNGERNWEIKPDPSITNDEIKSKMINETAPKFTLVDLSSKKVSLQDFKGKTVIIDFWAPWCGPCKASFPGMQKVIDKYASDPNVKFLFINTMGKSIDDREKNAEAIMKKNNYTFHVLLDSDNKVSESYKVYGIPTKFIIDKEGNIRCRSDGFGGDTDVLVEELSTMIEMVKNAK